MPNTPTTPASTTFTPPTQGYSTYTGRFAPSPTGPLHFGSLISALASFLDAKAHQGQWLVRIEDLDPPREQLGATELILRSLDAHHLHWDGAVTYQSQRHAAYEDCLNSLQQQQLAYACSCSRQELNTMGGIYDGRCRNGPLKPDQACALRLKLYDLPRATSPDIWHFKDIFQGEQQQNLRTHAGDQILKRRDGFYAYQLAVVVDDIAQGITHIIRGSDLLEVSARQLFLFKLLAAPLPIFGHVPLALQENGQKLSKQNQAAPLDNQRAGINLWHALAFLGQNPPQDIWGAAPATILSWAQAHWCRARVKGLGHLYTPETSHLA